MERIVMAVVLAAALLPLVAAAMRARSYVLSAAAVGLWLLAPAAVLLVLTNRPRAATEADVSERPIAVKVEEDDYVTSRTCRPCHPQEHASWHRSYHRTMTQIATSENVVGRFDGQEVTFYGFDFRMKRDGDEFWMEQEAAGKKDRADGKNLTRRLIMTTGSHHVQKYWYSTGKGRELGLAPLVYLIESDRWVPEQTSFLRPPKHGVRISEGRWNSGCNQCHSTGSEPRLFGPEDIDTRVAEFGIACESCHGPAGDHIRRNRDPLRRYRHHIVDEPDDSIVNPARLSAARSSQVCGQCHGAWLFRNDSIAKEWKTKGHVYRPGDDLHASRHYLVGSDDQSLKAAVSAEDGFWSDGEIRVVGREYNGLISSPCHTHGDPEKKTLSCLSCHAMHKTADDPRSLEEWADDQLGANMEGNRACLQCHGDYGTRIREHTHHEPGSSGSLCYNCHMPHTTYGLMRAQRSHTIDSPTVKTSLDTGRPNACNQCHLDKTLEWTAEQLNSWYGQEKPELDVDQRSIAASVLWALRGDAAQRAMMAWSLGWKEARQISGSEWMMFYLSELMFDPYDAVRYMAERSLRSIPGYEGIEYDHMNPGSKRQVVVQVSDIWSAQSGGKTPPAKATLFSSTGIPRLDVIRRLSQERDNSSVVISE